MIHNIDINKKVVSTKVSFGKKDFKYLIGCKDAKKVRPLFIFLTKTSTYRRDFDKTKCMSFLMKDRKLLEKYNKIWKNTATLSKKNSKVKLYSVRKLKN